MNLYNLFEAPKNTPQAGTTGIMPNNDQKAASPIGSGTSEWEQKKKPVTMMGVGNNGVVAEARDVQLDEISNKILGDYKKAAGADATAADKAGDIERGNKRFKGIVRATIKQGENDAKRHKEQGVAEGAMPPRPTPQGQERGEKAQAAVKAKNKEQFLQKKARQQGVTEVSKATLDRYVPAAVTAHGHADFSARQSKDDPTLRSYHKSQKHTAEKRRQGISRALDRMSKEQGMAEGATDDPRFQKMMGNIQRSTPNPVSGYVAVSYASERPSKKIKGVTYNGKPMPSTVDPEEFSSSKIKFTPDQIEATLAGIGQKYGWDKIDPGHGPGYDELYFDTSIEYTSATQRKLAINIVKTVNEINKFFNDINRSLQATGLPGYKVDVWQGMGENGNINQYEDLSHITNIAKGQTAKPDTGPAIGKVILKHLPSYEAENDELGYDPQDFQYARDIANIYITKGERAGLQAQHGYDYSPVSDMIDELLSDAGASDLRTIWSLDEQGMAESIDTEELANEVYAEFERIYPNLARRADERTVHAAIMDVLNYGGDSDPSALAQDVARAVKQEMQQGMAEGKKPDSYHIVNKDGKPATLASYADQASAEKDRDAKHPGAEVKQLGPRGKVKGVAEAIPLDKLRSTAGSADKDDIGDRLKKSMPKKSQSYNDPNGAKKLHKDKSVKESLGRATPKMPKARDPGHAVLAAKRSSGAAGRHTNKKRQEILQPKHQKPLTKDMDLDEGWKSKLGGAALAGAMALGGASAQAANYQPNMVAHITYSVNGQKVTKDINLGSQYESPSAAADAVTQLLRSKGIKYFFLDIERVGDDRVQKDYMDSGPATDRGGHSGIDTRPYRPTAADPDKDYMVREELDESIERRLMQMRRAGYDIN